MLPSVSRLVLAFLCRVAIACTLLCATGPARAQPGESERDTARTAMKRGDAAAAVGDHAGALAAYQQADAIMAVPTTGQAVARTLARLGRLVEAHNKALDVTRIAPAPREPKAFAEARDAARAFAREIEPRIPTLLVVPAPGPARFRVAVDDVDVPEGAERAPWRVNPGEHTVDVRADGHATTRLTVRVAERDHQKLSVVLKPLVPVSAPPPPREDRGIAPELMMGLGYGLGGAAFVVAGVTGAVAIERGDALAGQCDPGTRTCPESARELVEEGDRYATISNIGFIAGGVATAVGIVGTIWFVMREGSDEGEGVVVGVGPGNVTLRGAF